MNAPAVLAVAPGLAISRTGALARITLERPCAANAIDAAMRRELAAALPGFARDPGVYAVTLGSSHPSCFSSGGDMKELVAAWRADPALGRALVAEECRLVWMLECFSKPFVSLIDGLVMGSGVGISLYGTHRVAGAGYRFAMPETVLGFFPDVGVARTLGRLADRIGVFLALTGRAIGRADAYRLGLATHCIARARFGEIEAALADGDPVDPLLDARHEDPGPGDLEPHRAFIREAFAAPTVAAIVARLERAEGPSRNFAEGVLRDLADRSPTALELTLRHVREAAHRDIRQTLEIDDRLARRCLAGPDVHEGVRARLLDKDGRPRWRPARLSDVTPAQIEDYFRPDPRHDLHLPTRAEMQAARV